MIPLEHFSSVVNFLVIEEPIPEMAGDARKMDVGSKGKIVSVKQWAMIKCWHIIEPAELQMYVCMDLNCPHYQVSKTERGSFLHKLQEFTSEHPEHVIKTYSKDVDYTTNSFLTVSNGTATIGALSKHYS